MHASTSLLTAAVGLLRPLHNKKKTCTHNELEIFSSEHQVLQLLPIDHGCRGVKVIAFYGQILKRRIPSFYSPEPVNFLRRKNVSLTRKIGLI